MQRLERQARNGRAALTAINSFPAETGMLGPSAATALQEHVMSIKSVVQSSILSLLLAGNICQASPEDSNVVNERPPVSRTALEARWEVDCGAARTLAQRLLAELESGRRESLGRAMLDPLLRELQLCSAIDKSIPPEPPLPAGIHQQLRQRLLAWQQCLGADDECAPDAA